MMDDVRSPLRSPRLPPGQVETKGWPVLHYGSVPRIDLTTWSFRVFGVAAQPQEWNWQQINALPRQRVHCDIHCVTHWSKFENTFEGIRMADVLTAVQPAKEAKFAIVHAEGGFTTNVPVDDLKKEDVILATHHSGLPLSEDHGGPMRLIVPHLYFWKSAKWIRGIELVERDRPGFWERNGYHMRGDPWAGERYSFS